MFSNKKNLNRSVWKMNGLDTGVGCFLTFYSETVRVTQLFYTTHTPPPPNSQFPNFELYGVSLTRSDLQWVPYHAVHHERESSCVYSGYKVQKMSFHIRYTQKVFHPYASSYEQPNSLLSQMSFCTLHIDTVYFPYGLTYVYSGYWMKKMSHHSQYM